MGSARGSWPHLGPASSRLVRASNRELARAPPAAPPAAPRRLIGAVQPSGWDSTFGSPRGCCLGGVRGA
eukprot:2531728-Alexandrium_andersonii.AAC.1